MRWAAFSAFPAQFTLVYGQLQLSPENHFPNAIFSLLGGL